MTTKWRSMDMADLDQVVGVARIAFPDHPEDAACFAERLSLYPAGCRILADEHHRIVGYGIAYPWMANDAPALNALIGAIPDAPALLYLHDLALMPDARGDGAATRFVEWLAGHAQCNGWDAIALVAVNHAAGFWLRHGFVVDESAEMAGRIGGYGDDARYMVRHATAADKAG